MKNLSPMKLAEGLLDEVLAVVYKYSEAMPVATAVGVLELAKMQLVQDHMDDEEDDE